MNEQSANSRIKASIALELPGRQVGDLHLKWSDNRQRATTLMCGQHPAFDGLDCPLGLSARAAAEYGHGPVIGLGILDITGEKGRLGGGIYDMPPTVFEAAVAALGD